MKLLHFVQKCDRHTRALILTIAVCYYAKLQHREDFEKYIAPLLIRNAPDAPKIIKEEIIRYFIFIVSELTTVLLFIQGAKKYF